MTNFDINKELEELECPSMFVAGLKFYIDSNNLKIKNKKDFEKVLKDYSKLNIGE